RRILKLKTKSNHQKMTFYTCLDEPFFIEEHVFLEIEYRGKTLRQKFYILPKVRAEKILVGRETIKMLMEEEIFVPIVTTLHGTDITLVGSHPFYRPAVTFSINKSNAVTAVSQSLKEDTLRLFDIKNNIHVVHNFIDLDRYNNTLVDCQRGIMAKENEKIITHISNLRPVKRAQDVISIFYNIQKAIPARLMLIGEGPDREQIEIRCQELGILDKVIFFGKSNEIDKILCFSDLFLLPSETESFGLAALEAMAAWTPVISSNAGGLSEVNIQGYSGFLSNVGDIEDMTKNALHILSDTERLKTFKTNARNQAIKFDLRKIVPQYEAVYKETLSKCIK
ncbi:MAG: N-acetyl-alpha-D-glucosaminyl L-malate synthase BshA, partial [Aestuariibaculum sp.]